jgi:hypothetical protein
VRGEALPPEVLLGEAAALEEHAPRPVEHDDPLSKESLQL